MADANYTDLFGNLLSAGTSIGSNVLQNNALSSAQNNLSSAYGQAGQYVQGAQQTAAGYAAPYMAAGLNSIPAYLRNAQAVGSPLSMQQYQQGAYGQVANDAQKNNADAIKAMSSATGSYGSGNMANALQQNALSTQLGFYDKANQQNLTQQQAANAAMYQPVALGQVASQNLGQQTINSATSMSNLATSLGGASFNTALQQGNLNSGLLNSLVNPNTLAALSAGGKALYEKLAGGGALTPTEASSFSNELMSVGGTTDFSSYYDTPLTSLGGTDIALSDYYTGGGIPTSLGVDTNLSYDQSYNVGGY